MLGYSSRTQVEGKIDSSVDSTVVRFRHLFTVEHNDDGTHSDITGNSLTLTSGKVLPGKNTTTTGNITSNGGTLVITGVGPHRLGGNLRVNQAGTSLVATDNAVDIGLEGSIATTDGRLGPGFSFLLGTSNRYDLTLFNDGPPNPYGIRFMDVTAGKTPLELMKDPIGGSYWLAPGKDSSATLEVDLGTAFYGGVRGKWQNLYLAGNANISGTINGASLTRTLYGTFNDASAHNFDVVANTFGIVQIGSTAGVTDIPFFANGGSGVAWHFTALDPDTGWVINGSGISFSFTDGSGTNTYTFAINSGSGVFSVQRTGGSTAYTVSLVSLN